MGRNKTSPFASLISQLPAVPEEPLEAVPQVLQRKPSQAKRNRTWEAQQEQVTFRGIPTELNAQLKELAEELGVTVSDVARAFLERGLTAYAQGELVLQPRLRIGKMTLFPGDR